MSHGSICKETDQIENRNDNKILIVDTNSEEEENQQTNNNSQEQDPSEWKRFQKTDDAPSGPTDSTQSISIMQ